MTYLEQSLFHSELAMEQIKMALELYSKPKDISVTEGKLAECEKVHDFLVKKEALKSVDVLAYEAAERRNLKCQQTLSNFPPIVPLVSLSKIDSHEHTGVNLSSLPPKKRFKRMMDQANMGNLSMFSIFNPADVLVTRLEECQPPNIKLCLS